MNELEEELRFQKIPIRRFGTKPLDESKDGSFWKKFRTRSANQNGAVSWLDFCPTEPYQLAATSGTRVVVYEEVRSEDESERLTPIHAISKFQDLAHCGSYRADGRLLVAGSEEGTVKVFNCVDRSLLRKFDGHKRAVHVSRFCTSQLRVLSGSDDATVRVWDLSEGTQLSRLDGHRDYVRAADQSPTSVDIWATGGYDHVCRIWDVRTQTNIMDLDHGAPIESIAFFPSGTLLATAGGSYLKVWDVLNTGQTLRKLEKHHKTITCVGVLNNVPQVNGPRLCSVSLDQHLKIYDLDEFKVVHDSRYQHPLLSFAAAPNGRCYAVGMANGVVICRDNKQKHTGEDKSTSEADELHSTPKINAKRHKLSGFQKLVRKFRYKDALDLVMKDPNIQIVTALFEELAARDGVIAALSGRDVEDLVPILKFINAHITNPNFTDHVLPLLQILLDLYENEFAAEPLRKLLDNILRKMQRETMLLIEMKELKGCIESVLSSQWH